MHRPGMPDRASIPMRRQSMAALPTRRLRHKTLGSTLLPMQVLPMRVPKRATVGRGSTQALMPRQVRAPVA
jgi:hypothetical protein